MSQEIIPFTPENWTVYDGGFIEFDGKMAFQGTALLNNFEFQNGTIEWDMYTVGKRGYPGIFFRMNEQQDYENFYVRPHKTNGYHYDALQYTPVYHGISCWQLYHGEGYTREAVIPSNQWVHYKLVVKDNQAKVFVGDMEKEMLPIHNLEHGITRGSVVLNGQTDGSAYFANFSVTTDITCSFGIKVSKPVVPGAITSWEVTESITNNKIDSENYPGKKFLDELKWKSIAAEESGMINLTRHITGNPFQPAWVYARTILHSDSDKCLWYSFGYSDYITVFLNGNTVYQGINAFTSRDPSYAGLLGYFDKVKLNLKKGDNELVLLVGEEFGGWGFSFRNAETEVVASGIEKKWEILNGLNYPESVAWDKENKVLYVSNYLRGQSEYISKISVDGEIIEQEWIRDVKRPTALLLLGDNLYVVERKAIAIVDVKSAKIQRRITVADAMFLNDIAVTPDGKTFFVSDSQGSRIYKIENGVATEWLRGELIDKPNALAVDGNNLLVGSIGRLVSVNISTKDASQILSLFPGTIIDGLQVLEDGTILFDDFQGRLYSYSKNKNLAELINISSRGINFSDFMYIKEKGIIIIPGVFSNSIVGYSYLHQINP